MEHFSDDVGVVMRDPILFGDFRTALQEEEARVYEDIQDYEAAKALFQVGTGLAFSEGPFPWEHFSGEPCTAWELGGRSWEEFPWPHLRAQNVSLCLIRRWPCPAVCGSDLRNVLNTQTQGSPSGFPFIQPMEGPRVPITAGFGNHSAPCPHFHFIS